MTDEQILQIAAPAQSGKPVGTATTMPGTKGFTMAVFAASDVPIGANLYAAPQPAQTAVVLDDERAACDAAYAKQSGNRLTNENDFGAGWEYAIEWMQARSTSPQPVAQTERALTDEARDAAKGEAKPVEPTALASSISVVEVLSNSEDRDLTTDEMESMMLVLHELRRLQAVGAARPVTGNAELVDQLRGAHRLDIVDFDLYLKAAEALSDLAAPEVTADDARDARRYRALRRGQKWSVIDGVGGTLRAEQLDKAIDAAQTSAQPASGADHD